MTDNLTRGTFGRIALVICLASFLGMAGARAGDLELRAQLIWGTDEARPKDNKVKDLDEGLRKKLCRVFKWKNYFEISEQKVTLSSNETKRIKMSDKCELEIHYIDDETIEVKFFGEKRLTKTIRQPIKALRQGELGVIGGDDKEKYDDAWFVVLSSPNRD